MIDWDEMPWAEFTAEEMEAFESRLDDEVDWILHSREAEQMLTGQES